MELANNKWVIEELDVPNLFLIKLMKDRSRDPLKEHTDHFRFTVTRQEIKDLYTILDNLRVS